MTDPAVTNGIDTAQGYLDVAEREAQRIVENRWLSDEGKRDKIRRVRESAAALAAEYVQGYLDELVARERNAKRNVQDIEGMYRAQIDAQRDDEHFAMERVKPIVEYGDYDEVAALVREAVEREDAARLRALSTLAPQIRQRFAGHAQHSVDAGQLGNDVRHALDALVPRELQWARQAHQAAVDELATGISRADNLRLVYEVYRGLPMRWLDEILYGKPDVTTETDEAGNILAYTHVGGRGPFG